MRMNVVHRSRWMGWAIVVSPLSQCAAIARVNRRIAALPTNGREAWTRDLTDCLGSRRSGRECPVLQCVTDSNGHIAVSGERPVFGQRLAGRNPFFDKHWTRLVMALRIWPGSEVGPFGAGQANNGGATVAQTHETRRRLTRKQSATVTALTFEVLMLRVYRQTGAK